MPNGILHCTYALGHGYTCKSRQSEDILDVHVA